jgi:hypothetical protein
MEVDSVVPRRRGITSSERSKLKMPVKRMSFFAKKNGYANSVRIAGSVHMAGVLEELAGIILTESWDRANETKSGSIRLKDVRRALEVDGDLRGLNRVLKTRICGGGVERTVRPKPSTDPVEVEKAKSDSKKRRKARRARQLRKEVITLAVAMGAPLPVTVVSKVPSTKAAKSAPHPFAAKTVAAKAAALVSLKGKNVASKVSTSAVLLGLKKKTPAEKTVAFLETADEEEEEEEDEEEDEEEEE